MEPDGPPGGEPRDPFGLERLVFFSDAVVAIAITLLALDIRLPTVPAAGGLPRALLALWPRYLGFAVSFLVVGSFWLGHHRMFRLVRRYDDGLLWRNLLFLLCIALLPFASAVLGEHGDEPSATVFYSLVVVVTGLVETLLWRHATRGHRLVDPGLPARAVRLGFLRLLTAPVVFLLTLPLVLLHPYVAMVAWLATYPIVAVLLRAGRPGGAVNSRVTAA